MARRYTAEEICNAIRETRGFVSKAADLLGCTVQTIYNYRNEYVSVKAAIKESRERRTDYVESKLMQAIDGLNVTAIIFYLKTQAKDRGYIERMELTGDEDKPLHIRYIQEARPDGDDG